MSVLVYRQKPSTGAADLAESLDAVRFRGRTMPIECKARRGDIIISWGETLPQLPGVRTLNGAAIRGKYQDATALREAGVPTITVSLTRPPAQLPPLAPPDPAIEAFGRAQELASAFADVAIANVRNNPILNQGLTELTGAIAEFSRQIMYPAPQAPPFIQKLWIPRKNSHVGGNDLLGAGTAPVAADYWVVKEEIVKEFRIHSFLGKSIRAGVKALRDGFTTGMDQDQARVAGLTRASEWIRSWDGGWRIKYDGVSSKKKHRELAHSAVKALGLDFGAVDIGERADGSLIVLEVNRAPGLAEGTIDVYAHAISRWIAGETQVDEPTNDTEIPF